MREEFTIQDPPFSIKDGTEFEQMITREVSVFTVKDAEWLLDDSDSEISKQLIDGECSFPLHRTKLMTLPS